MKKSSRSNQEIQELLTEARKNQILDAACEVFAEKGFQRSTVREVAESAGIAAGTIYNYFPDKSGLLFALLHRLNDREKRSKDLSGTPATDFRTFFEGYLRQRFEALSGKGLKAFQVLISECLVDPELRERYMEEIAAPTMRLAEEKFGKLVEAGEIRDLEVPLMVRTIAATFMGLLIMRLLGDGPIEEGWQDLPGVISTLLLQGLLPDEAGSK